MSIFISIASYRDPQLIPTIMDCLAKARRPDDLRFGVCWQHGPDEPELPFADDSRFRILDVDWRESRGACWARAEIMRLWQGEDFFLQLDSHHRFAADWDVKLLHHLECTGSPKPILTAYTTPYTPGEPEPFESEPLQMNFDRFTEEAIVLFRPGAIPNWQDLNRPVRARFLSAHFFFTTSEFIKEVPYDPELYFIGEEITLTIRAFTHGYDLFHPPEVLVYHEYTREGRTKHWDDHVKAQGVELEWHQRDASSKEKVKRFLAEPFVGEFGCGTARTFDEYETYAGLSFRHRQVQDYTRRGEEPPNPPAPAGWAEQIRAYLVPIELDRAALEPEACADPMFWYVGFHDADGLELYRRDADAKELRELLAGKPSRIVIEREFSSNREPVSWTVWPVSRSGVWLQKREGRIDRKPAPATLVTALLDIGRDNLSEPFGRSFQDNDLPLFARLLAIDLPMVIYVEPKHADVVWRVRRPHNTKVIPLSVDDLRRFPYFEEVQAIRTRPDWFSQAGWLPYSPQAALESYAPLVMSKMRWLDEQARQNPFGTEHLFWIDAGLGRTVGEHLLMDGQLGRRLAAAAEDFLFIGYPYAGSSEIHGFAREALTRAAGVDAVDRVIRGGFFGGRAQAVTEVAELYDHVLADTLAAGHMGTEESVFTILSYQHPQSFHCYMVEANGLVYPFFEALLEGHAESLLLTAPEPAAPERRWPPGIVGEDVEVARLGATTFLGLSMMQNRNAIFAWEELTQHLAAQGVRVARIIELGTGFGGLSVFLQVYCLAQGAQFITYDHSGGARELELFKRLQIDLRVRDITHEFTLNEIADEIQRDGVTIVACDGGDKPHEVNTFADYLKTGDIIMAHDYAPSHEQFERDLNGRLWSWCEITDDVVRPTIERNELEPVLPDVMQAAVWACWIKRGTAVRAIAPITRVDRIGLYVLSFNAPEQFRAWIESVEEVAPALLRDSQKVLVNNSTDNSTFEAYDDLCRRYGFAQFHFDNIGINGGRMWCAKHFDAETDCDAMLYFEDDMLLHTTDGVCRNGFRTYVPDLFDLAKQIVRNEGLDFLKLCYTELHGDHAENWAYRNLGEEDRAEYFPNGHGTRVDAIKSYGGLSYLVGDVFYSNWPMLITRRGSHAMFLSDGDLPLWEQLLMVRALKLTRAGALRGGVLLASPINHNRFVHYGAGERREC